MNQVSHGLFVFICQVRKTGLGGLSAAAALSLCACVATQGPLTPNAAPAGAVPAAAAAAPPPVATKPQSVPLYVPTTNVREVTGYDLFDFGGASVASGALAVNKACAAAAEANRNALFQYVAGDCNTQGLVEGIAAAKLARTNVIVEGLFANGQPTRGLLYRVFTSELGSSYSTGPDRIKRVYDCGDMVVVSAEFRNGYGILNAASSPKTVCREGGFDSLSSSAGRRWTRVLKPTADGAVQMDRTVKVRAEAPGTARLLFPDRLEEVEGAFLPRGNNDELIGLYAYTGRTRVAFSLSRQWYVFRGGLMCVENTSVCGPRFGTAQYQNYVASGPVLLGGSGGVPLRPVGGRFEATDGTVFEPVQAANTIEVGYGVSYGVQRPQGNGWLAIGDAVFVRPINGSITYPDGRKYSGRFTDGKPLFQ